MYRQRSPSCPNNRQVLAPSAMSGHFVIAAGGPRCDAAGQWETGMIGRKSVWPALFYATSFAGLACSVCWIVQGMSSRWSQGALVGFGFAAALICDRKLKTK